MRNDANAVAVLKDRKDRIFEVDAVKFMAIFYMICEHVYERFGSFDYFGKMPDTLYRNFVEFFGGPMAAPVFMFCMGIGMIYTRHDSSADFIRRGIKLLLAGYLLNFFRQTIPMLIAMRLGIDTGFSLIGGLLNVDILPFAGMAFISIGLMKRFKMPLLSMLATAILLQAVGIWSVNLRIDSVAAATLIGLILPGGDHVAFPMTLWLIYPTAGIMFGEMLKASEDRRSLYMKALIASSAFFVSYNAALIYCGYDIRLSYALYEGSYYYQTLISTLWILPIVMIALSLSYLVLSSIEQTLIGRFMRYCSINLTTIYIIQWLLIGYGTGVGILLGFTSTDSPIVITMIAAALMVSAVLISLICVKVKGRKVKAAAKSAA